MPETRLGFLRQLAAAPWDETLWLVYADWLEENGYPAAGADVRGSAAGFRVLFALGHYPRRGNSCPGGFLISKFYHTGHCYEWWPGEKEMIAQLEDGTCKSLASQGPVIGHDVAPDWYDAIFDQDATYGFDRGYAVSKDYLTARRAFRGLARAFALLPDARRDALQTLALRNEGNCYVADRRDRAAVRRASGPGPEGPGDVRAPVDPE